MPNQAKLRHAYGLFFLEHLPLNASAQVIDTTASSFVEGYYRGRLTSHVVIGLLFILYCKITFAYLIFSVCERQRIRTSAKAIIALIIISGTNITDTEGFSHALQTAARQFIEAQHSRLDNGEGKEELIRQLVEKNENKSVFSNKFVIIILKIINSSSNRRYSRQCNICLTPSPDSRVTLTGCGHLMCMACAMQIEVTFHLNI